MTIDDIRKIIAQNEMHESFKITLKNNIKNE